MCIKSKQPFAIIVAMLYSKPELVRLAVQIAQEFQLDPALICAHIDIRSHWDSGLTLPTATYYLAPYRSAEESQHRSLVWGLMGISGEFARQENYTAPLPDLLEPPRNLHLGCTLISRLQSAQREPVRAAVECLTNWNREHDRERAAQTLLKLEAYRELIARIPLAPRTFPYADSSLLQSHSQIEGNPLLDIGESTRKRSLP